MRRFGIRVNPAAHLAMTGTPVNHAKRDLQRRRLEDDVQQVFHRACETAEFEAAADLLELLEKWDARRSSSYGMERRISGARVREAREELRRLSRN